MGGCTLKFEPGARSCEPCQTTAEEWTVSRYLIVAHQTATSPELRREIAKILRTIRRRISGIIVPASVYGGKLLSNEDAAYASALERSGEAREMLDGMGASVLRTAVGGANPYEASPMSFANTRATKSSC